MTSFDEDFKADKRTEQMGLIEIGVSILWLAELWRGFLCHFAWAVMHTLNAKRTGASTLTDDFRRDQSLGKKQHG